MTVNEVQKKKIEVEEAIELFDGRTGCATFAIPENKYVVMKSKGQDVGHIPASRGFTIYLEVVNDSVRVCKDNLIISVYYKVDEVSIYTYK